MRRIGSFIAAMLMAVSQGAFANDSGSQWSDDHLTPRTGTFMLDYQYIDLAGDEAIDLLGYHLMTPVTDWLSFGIGSYIPVVAGEYGGFMGFGTILHAERKIAGNLFVDGGLSFGGGGGGKSSTDSIRLSGTGGFIKAYAGLGYDFERFKIGANISQMTFFGSEIDSVQANLFVSRPLSYSTAGYSKASQTFFKPGADAEDGDIGIITLGVDDYTQLGPVGSFAGKFGTADLQYSRFMTEHTYWYYAFGAGYKGMPLYNQVIAGVGAKLPVTSRINLYAQLGIGSGGYAPSRINTGSGFLVFPKASAEFMVTDNIGLAGTVGYLAAPDGTSRNMSVGAALNYHLRSANTDAVAQGGSNGRYQASRLSVSHETMTNLKALDADWENNSMLTLQLDQLITDHIYIPLRGSISLESYRGYPGYGEVSTGIGLQTAYDPDDRFQFFGELHAGANVEGALARGIVGADYALGEDYAIRGYVGQAVAARGFSSTNIGLGVVYRFSQPRF